MSAWADEKELKDFFFRTCMCMEQPRGLVWVGLVWCRGVRSAAIGKGCRSHVPMEERSIQKTSMRLAMSHSFCLSRGRLAVIALIPAVMATLRPPRQLSFPHVGCHTPLKEFHNGGQGRTPSRAVSVLMSFPHYVTLRNLG